jgi:hypothetical protein
MIGADRNTMLQDLVIIVQALIMPAPPDDSFGATLAKRGGP